MAKYKQTAAVKKVIQDMDNFISGMAANKPLKTLHLSVKQYRTMLEDLNKKLSSDGKKGSTSYDSYKGIEVSVYNG